MKWIPRSTALLAVALAVLPSCKKKHSERVESDLGEAGYQLTADDWFRASRQNDVAVMKKFTSGGFAVDQRNPEGDTALHAAVAAGSKAAAEYLLNRGLAVDVRGADERTPLMAAVIGKQVEMTGWLLRQGADPKLKDKNGFKALMLASREGCANCVGELAAYDREDLDGALLLAAMEGRTEVIDALTNYGASVYARMEDGRTPLMVAAENGHTETVKLLLDIGANRYATDADGRTAVTIAGEAGHPEIAGLIARDPRPDELSLETPEEIAVSMEVPAESAAGPGKSSSGAGSRANRATPIEGAILSKTQSADRPPPATGKPVEGGRPEVESFAMPPLVMRNFREREIPLRVVSVRGDTATLRVDGKSPRDVKLRAGDGVPGSDLVVVRVQRRIEDSKVSVGKTVEISVVEVRDRSSGISREWIAGYPSDAHDPVALVEDAATGRLYLASPGQRFRAADGAEFLVSEVRPNQLVIREVETGAVRTIPLRGPRG